MTSGINIRILVTGANGQLGSELRKLAQQPTAFQWQFTDVEEMDITSNRDISGFFGSFRPHVLINCAAYTAVDKAETDAETAFRINETAVGYLADACVNHNTLMVHISTDYVFDGFNHTPYTESGETSPVGVYAKSKAAGEKVLLQSGCRYLLVRTSWLYSPYGHNFLKTILRLAAERPELRVVADQTGTPTAAEPLAKALLEMIPIVLTNPGKQGIYHVACEGVCSWYDFAHEIIRASGLECKVIPITTAEYPLPAHRPPYSVMSKAKLRNSFGIEMPHWRSAMLDCIRQLNSQ